MNYFNELRKNECLICLSDQNIIIYHEKSISNIISTIHSFLVMNFLNKFSLKTDKKIHR